MKGEGVIIAYFFTIQSFVGLFPFPIFYPVNIPAPSLLRVYYTFHSIEQSTAPELVFEHHGDPFRSQTTSPAVLLDVRAEKRRWFCELAY